MSQYRLRVNHVQGVIDAALASGDTQLASAQLAALPDCLFGEGLAITLEDPATGAFEIVHVSQHFEGDATAAIVRGQEGSTAQAWAAGTVWKHAPTSADFTATVPSQADRDALPQIFGMFVYRSDLDAVQVLTSAGWKTVTLA